MQIITAPNPWNDVVSNLATVIGMRNQQAQLVEQMKMIQAQTGLLIQQAQTEREMAPLRIQQQQALTQEAQAKAGSAGDLIKAELERILALTASARAQTAAHEQQTAEARFNLKRLTEDEGFRKQLQEISLREAQNNLKVSDYKAIEATGMAAMLPKIVENRVEGEIARTRQLLAGADQMDMANKMATMQVEMAPYDIIAKSIAQNPSLRDTLANDPKFREQYPQYASFVENIDEVDLMTGDPTGPLYRAALKGDPRAQTFWAQMQVAKDMQQGPVQTIDMETGKPITLSQWSEQRTNYYIGQLTNAQQRYKDTQAAKKNRGNSTTQPIEKSQTFASIPTGSIDDQLTNPQPATFEYVPTNNALVNRVLHHNYMRPEGATADVSQAKGWGGRPAEYWKKYQDEAPTEGGLKRLLEQQTTVKRTNAVNKGLSQGSSVSAKTPLDAYQERLIKKAATVNEGKGYQQQLYEALVKDAVVNGNDVTETLKELIANYGTGVLTKTQKETLVNIINELKRY